MSCPVLTGGRDESGGDRGEGDEDDDGRDAGSGDGVHGLVSLVHWVCSGDVDNRGGNDEDRMDILSPVLVWPRQVAQCRCLLGV